MPLPIVAVVGRPNVGKSTFVNRIAQADEAIVHEMRGVTRDRSYHEADWNGVDFKLIDTGGIEMGDDDAFQGSIRNQALAGANEADVILFLVDGKTGVNADDEAVARILRKTSKPVFLVVNKLDTPNRMDEVWEFYQLGLGDPWPVSAMHGHGTGDLLDEVVNELKKVDLPADADELDRALADACARALVESAADHVNAAIVAAAMEEGLYTDDRLSPGMGDFPLDTRSQFVFYTQSEKRLGLKLGKDGVFEPRYSTVGVIGLYDPSHKGRKRACGRCKYRSYCSIRAIGMTCHGGKGSFK